MLYCCGFQNFNGVGNQELCLKRNIDINGEDENRPKKLKALTGEGILWLTQGCKVAWKYGTTTRDWQTGVIIPIFEKGHLM